MLPEAHSNSVGIFLSRANIWRRLKVRRQIKREELMVKRKYCNSIPRFDELDTFPRAIRTSVCVAQLFGVMPVTNILQSDSTKLEFRWRSLSMFFTAFFLVCGGLRTLHLIAGMLKSGINLKNMVGIVFFSINLVICINFIGLARCWPQLMRQWLLVDLTMSFPPYRPSGWTLQRRVCTFAGCFAALAIIEHILYYVSQFYSYRMRMLHCNANVTQVTLHNFFVDAHFKDTFDVLPYNIVVLVWAFFLNFTFTFIWNYLDLFIMLISLAIAVRFQQFAERVLALNGRYVADELWYDIRQDHILLCEFIENVNEKLSSIILISALNAIYFICNQLLNIFTTLRYPINYVYFWYSLFFLLGRTASVYMCGSRIHDAARLPLKTLYMVPSAYWTEEVQRFMQQLTTECIGLSGNYFYYVTRQSLFGLIASIVTYEFMLLQLEAKSRKQGLPDLCA